MDSPLEHLARCHPGPWGRVLDAGTGQASCSWLSRLPCPAWVALTCEPARAEGLRQRISLRPQDQILVGDWRDPELLRGQRFEVVVADYLLGACERYAPHFQEQLLERLCEHSSHWLYIIGQEPPEGEPENEVDDWFQRVASWRDGLQLLSGRRPHRELPEGWVLQRMQGKSHRLMWSAHFTNTYDHDYLERELGAMGHNLEGWSDRGLAQVMRRQVHQLRRQGQALLEAHGGSLSWGRDYLLAFSAEPPVATDRLRD